MMKNYRFALAAALLAFAATAPQEVLAQTKSGIPIKKYRQLLTDYCWYIPNGGEADYLCLETNGRFTFMSGRPPYKKSAGEWQLQGKQLTLTFANGKAKTSSIEFLSTEQLRENGKVTWTAEMN